MQLGSPTGGFGCGRQQGAQVSWVQHSYLLRTNGTTAEASISQVYGRDLMYDDVRVCVGIMVPQLVSLSDGGPIEINIIVGYCR